MALKRFLGGPKALEDSCSMLRFELAIPVLDYLFGFYKE